MNPHPNPKRWAVLLFYRRENRNSKRVSAHLIGNCLQGAELGFELGKSGTEANVLGYRTQLPPGRKVVPFTAESPACATVPGTS